MPVAKRIGLVIEGGFTSVEEVVAAVQLYMTQQVGVVCVCVCVCVCAMGCMLVCMTTQVCATLSVVCMRVHGE